MHSSARQSRKEKAYSLAPGAHQDFSSKFTISSAQPAVITVRYVDASNSTAFATSTIRENLDNTEQDLSDYHEKRKHLLST